MGRSEVCHPDDVFSQCIFACHATAQGGVEGSESLVNAALRELREEFGADLDVWQTGKVPAAHHAYRLPEPTPKGQQDTAVSHGALTCDSPSNHLSSILARAMCCRRTLSSEARVADCRMSFCRLIVQVFFMPARVMRGTPQPNKQESLVDYAWCTKEEIQEKISADLYTSVAKVLSE